VEELYSGARYGEAAREIAVEMRRGETLTFRLS
jgi:hypothetical protein